MDEKKLNSIEVKRDADGQNRHDVTYVVLHQSMNEFQNTALLLSSPCVDTVRF